LKVKLEKKFEIKDLRQLRYFFGIEVAREAEEIVLSHRKYVLNLLSEIDMLRCKLIVSPIDVKTKMSIDVGE
jgi:Reverse transcriptase (RNA-dependent DNA polymerase)